MLSHNLTELKKTYTIDHPYNCLRPGDMLRRQIDRPRAPFIRFYSGAAVLTGAAEQQIGP